MLTRQEQLWIEGIATQNVVLLYGAMPPEQACEYAPIELALGQLCFRLAVASMARHFPVLIGRLGL